MLDDGRLTDGQGRLVDFRNTVLVLTSNVGSQYIVDLCADQADEPVDVDRAVRMLLLHDVVEIEAGDAVLIPAGVAHKNLDDGDNFRVVGAYPSGQSTDMCYGKTGERPRADGHIAGVSLPVMDPVYGLNGALMGHWGI